MLIKPTSPRLRAGDPILKGLEFCVPFGETGGTRIRDLVRHRIGTFNTGTPASPTWKSTEFGRVLEFGVTTTRTQLSFPSINFGLSWSFSFWIKPLSGQSTGYSCILGSTADNADDTIVFYSEANGTIGFFNYDGAFWEVYATTSAITQGKWNHVVLVKVGGTISFYINGKSAGTATVSSTATWSQAGFIGDDVFAEPYKGYLDGMLMWPNRKLSTGDIQRLFIDRFCYLAESRLLINSDAAGGGTTFNDSVSESLSAADTISAFVTFASAAAESLTAADSQAATANFAASQTEALSAADAQAASANFAAADAEALSATDAQASTANFSATTAETGNMTDTPNATASMGAAAAETLSATDSQTTGAVQTGSVTETLTASDAVSATVTFAGAVSETLTASDAGTATASFAASAAEALTASDAPGATAVFVVAKQESLTALESAAGVGVFPCSRTESASASDSCDGSISDAVAVVMTLDLRSGVCQTQAELGESETRCELEPSESLATLIGGTI